MRKIDDRVKRLLWLDEYTQLIVVKSDNLKWIYKRQEDDKGAYQDSLWLEDGYKDLKIIMKSVSGSEKKYCFVYFEDEIGSHGIIEVVKKEHILNEYQSNHYKIVTSVS